MTAIDLREKLKGMEGRWVAFDDDFNVISHGEVLSQVVYEAKEKGYPDPILFRCPEHAAYWAACGLSSVQKDVIEENRRLQEELKYNNNLHRFYSSEIARAIGDQREKRSTGEPAKSDAEEIRRAFLEICRLKEEIRILKEKANG